MEKQLNNTEEHSMIGKKHKEKHQMNLNSFNLLSVGNYRYKLAKTFTFLSFIMKIYEFLFHFCMLTKITVDVILMFT